MGNFNFGVVALLPVVRCRHPLALRPRTASDISKARRRLGNIFRAILPSNYCFGNIAPHFFGNSFTLEWTILPGEGQYCFLDNSLPLPFSVQISSKADPLLFTHYNVPVFTIYSEIYNIQKIEGTCECVRSLR